MLKPQKFLKGLGVDWVGCGLGAFKQKVRHTNHNFNLRIKITSIALVRNFSLMAIRKSYL